MFSNSLTKAQKRNIRRSNRRKQKRKEKEQKRKDNSTVKEEEQPFYKAPSLKTVLYDSEYNQYYTFNGKVFYKKKDRCHLTRIFKYNELFLYHYPILRKRGQYVSNPRSHDMLMDENQVELMKSIGDIFVYHIDYEIYVKLLEQKKVI